MRELSIRSGRGFILVFAVDNLQSFHEAIQLWDLIQRLRDQLKRGENKRKFLPEVSRFTTFEWHWSSDLSGDMPEISPQPTRRRHHKDQQNEKRVLNVVH
ncbi:hypothetical protein TNIN_150081 [Trichonephila inaurata madagascariensis]|uniref:Uncharacterized protein n=1 Tax=Trichonephila inaurata madagascariensis TaxID=2747483 RepID=A0A8X7CMQ5_9ARAC|nr:hypothetical protein TNIN_150081 [Trichonephila inaurata madagascariensis]